MGTLWADRKMRRELRPTIVDRASRRWRRLLVGLEALPTDLGGCCRTDFRPQEPPTAHNMDPQTTRRTDSLYIYIYKYTYIAYKYIYMYICMYLRMYASYMYIVNMHLRHRHVRRHIHMRTPMHMYIYIYTYLIHTQRVLTNSNNRNIYMQS